jgi:hypothetical protein
MHHGKQLLKLTRKGRSEIRLEQSELTRMIASQSFEIRPTAIGGDQSNVSIEQKIVENYSCTPRGFRSIPFYGGF